TSSAGSPGGTVTVTDGVDSCTGQLQGASGSCALTLTTSGSRTLTAAYEGSPGFSSSAGSAQHTVNEPAGDDDEGDALGADLDLPGAIVPA
ncbi:MAG TPA: hypothetical protein VFO71_07070, partial [Gemmatimonadales bacterium]|nr:hypothetical protein [Gemmatimonadales bacterium]